MSISATADTSASTGAIAPTPTTINDGSYKPLSRPIFIYVSAAAAEDPTVDAFVDFYLDSKNAETLVAEVGYIPLPREIYDLAQERFDTRNTGSIFAGGSQVGLTLSELLRQEQR